MFRYLKLIPIQLKYSLATTMTYRVDFVMWLIVDLFWGGIQLIFFLALFGKISSLGGWNINQILLLLGLYRLLSACFWSLLWPNMWPIPKMVNRGELDLWVTKPINSQFFLSTRNITISNLSASSIVGCALIIYSVQQLSLHLNFLSILTVITLYVFSTVILYSIWFMSVTMAFYFGRINNIVHLFPEIFSIAQFPKTAFPIIMQVIITFIIPVGIITYTPAQIMLDRAQWWEVCLPVILAILLLYLSHRFWNFALKSYTSASS